MLSIQFQCRKITPSNFSEVPIGVEQPTFNNIEKLKKEHGFKRKPGEAYAVVLLLENQTNYEIADIDIKITAKIKPTATIDKIYSINIKEPSIKLGIKQKLPISLFEMSGLISALVSLGTVNYKIKNLFSTDYQTNAPLVFDMTELQNDFDGFKNIEEKQNVILLNNYLLYSLPARGILLKILLKSLHQINKDRKFEFNNRTNYFTSDETQSIRGFIQIDLVAKIMMYIEDLVILLEANVLPQGNFYQLLDKKEPDVGERITTFFNKLATLTLEDCQKMLAYKRTDDQTNKSIVKLIETNISIFKKILNTIRNFRNAHAQIYRRYKHAGFPILPGYIPLKPYGKTAKRFESYCLVFSEDDPFKRVSPLPYSSDVIRSYTILIQGLQMLLTDIVRNKLESIKRQTEGIIPPYYYAAPGTFSPTEQSEIVSELYKFYKQHHPHAQLQFMDLPISPTDNEKLWYAKLDEYFEEWGKNSATQNKTIKQDKQSHKDT